MRIMKRFFLLLFVIILAVPAMPQKLIEHPWQGKRVAYFGDSITDPRNHASKKKYWGFLQDWLQIEPYVYGVSGRQWNDIPRQADMLKAEHGDSVDAILILMGTNDYNSGIPIGEWFVEKDEKVMAGIHEQKHLVDRKHRYPVMCDSTYRHLSWAYQQGVRLRETDVSHETDCAVDADSSCRVLCQREKLAAEGGLYQ